MEIFRTKNFDTKKIKEIAKNNFDYQKIQSKREKLLNNCINGENSNATDSIQNSTNPRNFSGFYQEIYNEKMPEKYRGGNMDKFLKGEIFTLFINMNESILKAIGGEIELKKLYAIYKIKKTFASIEPYEKHLRIGLHIETSELKDPQKRVQDIGDKGHHGTYKSFAILKDKSEIPYILKIIKQSFEILAKKGVI